MTSSEVFDHFLRLSRSSAAVSAQRLSDLPEGPYTGWPRWRLKLKMRTCKSWRYTCRDGACNIIVTVQWCCPCFAAAQGDIQPSHSHAAPAGGSSPQQAHMPRHHPEHLRCAAGIRKCSRLVACGFRRRQYRCSQHSAVCLQHQQLQADSQACRNLVGSIAVIAAGMGQALQDPAGDSIGLHAGRSKLFQVTVASPPCSCPGCVSCSLFCCCRQVR
jgi:hypothetical protein